MEMSKNMDNLEIAKLLRSVAASYQIKSENNPNTRFRIIAYNNAADAVEHSTSEIKDLWDDKKLDSLPGVGKGIAGILDELFRTGTVTDLEDLFDGLSPAVFELMDVPGIGPKRAYKLTKELGISKAHGAFEKLVHACEKGRIRKIEGFGEQSEKEILESLKQVKERNKRLLLPFATIIAEEVINWMKGNPNVKQIYKLGSLRRQAATVGDIDIAVATEKPKEVIAHFVN